MKANMDKTNPSTSMVYHPGDTVTTGRYVIGAAYHLVTTGWYAAGAVHHSVTTGWRAAEAGICLSDCPSDWDKCKTPFVKPYSKGTYERRFKVQRRGQDSLEPGLLQSFQWR